ncbi:actin interacting protein 3 [Dimargaris cristalligena]|uniref:Actin interacting protein 3 n=1 Tax=Dimargaris cristalligena TaxID=215637 RepID=A0A4Q0A1X4_9FUNG|nr:actin interacting protein 3 [Dimargaris cristalligena]|eukprot:RKP40093.1 actin interacting protein 3 [Dimargaris cristalligena]
MAAPFPKPSISTQASLRRSTEYPTKARDSSGPSSPTEGCVYVQCRSRVKKVRPPTLPSVGLVTDWLVTLYQDTFQEYSVNSDYIPYICQPQSLTAYELEDINDLGSGCTLKFNLDDAVAMQPTPPSVTDTLATQVATIGSETKKISDLLQALELTQTTRYEQIMDRFNAAPRAESPSSSADSQRLARVASPLSTQALEKELKTTRQELSVLRQTHSQYRSETESLLTEIRREYDAMKQTLAKAPSALRALIESGKTKLGKSADEIAARNDELRTLIDSIRQDITQHRSRASPKIMAFIERECAAIEKELADHLAFVEDVKPVWKNAWEDELQNIMGEQLFVKDQQALLEDLQHENKVMHKFYQQLKQYATIQLTAGEDGAGGARSPRIIEVAPPEDGAMILQDVFQEIHCIDVNSQKRLEAFERAQKVRQRELEARTNEFEEELSGFVRDQKLRKTGGTEELERRREKKDREVLRLMDETQKQLLEYQREQRVLRQKQKAEQQRLLKEQQSALSGV